MGEQKPKVVLMLQDSAKGVGGVVYDCAGRTPLNDNDVGGLEAVGTWQRLGEGVICLELTNTIDARQDVLINSLKSLRESRVQEFGSPHILARYPHPVDTSGVEAPVRRRAAQLKPAPEVDNSAKFNSLRDKLKRK